MNKKELYRKLVEEITIIDINRFNYSDSFRAGEAAGKIKGLESAKKLLNQLDEPELPAIPQFVAEWIEESKGVDDDFWEAATEMIRDSITSLTKKGRKVHDWLFGNSVIVTVMLERQKLITRAWLDGYTIEKEQLYHVILKDLEEEKDAGQALYKVFNFEGDKIIGTHITPFSKRIVLEAGNFHFTEKEIKAIDGRYWAFAEPVEDEK